MSGGTTDRDAGALRAAPALGAPLDRVDGPLKVCGLARYAAEFDLPGLVHATMVLSGAACGRIRAIDCAAALAQPGVLHVMTPFNAPRLPEQGQTGKPPASRTLSLLQDDRVHYDRQPVALVIAETLEASREAARLLRVEIAPEAAELDFERAKAAAHAPKEAQGQAPDSRRGEPDAQWQKAALRHEAVYTTPGEHHNPLEMHATLAHWEGERLTLYDATQSVQGVRRTVALRLGLEPEQVRVVNPYVGGAFGCKGSAWSHVVLAAMAAREIGRPVRLALDRPQMFGPVGQRPRTEQRLRLATDERGRLAMLQHDVHAETARIEDWIEPSALVSRMLYACDHVATSHRLVPQNIGVPTFQRAPGEATGSFALEAAIDEMAHAAGIDPLQFRLLNHAERDGHADKPFSSKSLRACYAQGAERFGWSRRQRAPRSMREGRELIGWGMATATYPSKRMPAEARATLLPDGRVRVQCGTHELGTGTYTMLAQVAAATLGLPTDRVHVEIGDSDLPTAPISGGSMTTASTAPAVQAACDALARRLAEGHAERPLHAQARSAPADDAQQYAKHAFGAVFVEVRVDAELGAIRVPRIVGAYAVGRLLSGKTGCSQLLGGIVWGLSMALFEESLRDPRYGRIANANLAEYHVPVNADVPPIELIVVPEHDEHVNPLGAKGIGEIGITGVAGAVANAVWHATGRRVRSLPILLDDLL